MKQARNLILILAMVALTAGCASSGGGHWTDSRLACALAGGVAGGTVGAFDDSDAAVTGAVIGAGIGALFCGGKDTDGDGVKDSKDKCPGTPQGAPVDENGCEFDDDNDGVVNSMDRCPNTPAGVQVDANGCELDSDGDGVKDSKDKCPGTAKGTPVDNDGCDLEKAYALNGVNFEFDSARLTEDSKAILDEALRILQRHPDLKVEIAGHTDSTGSDTYNQGLSQRRAQSVMDYLVGKGANAANLTAKGYGESQPVADNGTKEGRAQNRRVEFRH